MSSIVYKVLWLICHFLVDVYEKVVLFVVWIRRNLIENQLVHINKHKLAINIIHKDCVQSLTKKPSHLVVILGTETPDYLALSKFVIWGLAAGINYVSFYDYQGVLKDTNFEIYRQLECRKLNGDEEQIVWVPQMKKEKKERLPHKNGFAKRVVVDFLGPEDGKHDMVNLCKLLCYEDVKLDEIDVKFIDKRLKERNFNIPDPDLAVFFGQSCGSYGLLPWQIRLTEFMSISPTLKMMNISDFTDILFKYARCEQRCGK